MIVAERKPKVALTRFDHFGEAMPDGRLTEPSDGKIYRLRDAIAETKRLGRMLTESELRTFEVTK